MGTANEAPHFHPREGVRTVSCHLDRAVLLDTVPDGSTFEGCDDGGVMVFLPDGSAKKIGVTWEANGNIVPVIHYCTWNYETDGFRL